MRLQKRLPLIIFPCATLSVILIVLAVYTAMYEKAKQDIAVRAHLELANLGYKQWESDRQSKAILASLASDNAIRDVLTFMNPSSQDFEITKEQLNRFLRLQQDSRSIIILDKSFNTVSSISDTYSTKFIVNSIKKAAQNNLLSESPILNLNSPKLNNATLNSYTLIYHAPVYDYRAQFSNEPIGWIVYENKLSIQPEDLTQSNLFIFSLTYTNAEGVVAQLSQGNPIPAVNNPFNAGEALPTNTATNIEPSVEIDNANGVIGQYELPGKLNLTVHAPKSHIRSSILSLSYLLAFATAVGTLLGVISFLALLKFLILDPLRHVRQTAMSIGLKEYANHDKKLLAAKKRGDEIGDLSRAIDSTHQRLTSTINDLKSSNQEVERLAFRDYLTDMPNRRRFLQLVEQQIGKSNTQQRPFSILFMDLDNFKNINDFQGHDAGDLLLQEVSRRLTDELGFNQNDEDTSVKVAARLGGDEFILLFASNPETDHESDIATLAQRILDVIQNPVRLGDRDYFVTASLGISRFPEHSTSVDGLITCADTAMYEAKRNHKNGFAIYDKEMLDNLASKIELVEDIREALATDQFSLHYQPKFALANQSLIGVEALIRWDHPVKGKIFPDQFIPVAEECGLINELGRWVIDEACRQWQQWNQSGTPVSHVAVNVSIRQFESRELRKHVTESIEKHGVPPSALEIELTESCVIEAYDDVCNTLTELRKDGIGIAVDDFGTGYSSLSLISNLPIDTLKIDRSFVTGLKSNSSHEKIVSTVITLAKQLDLTVVAEGIETDEELAFLNGLDCDIGQGYYLGKPLPASDLTNLLTDFESLHGKAA